MSFCLELVSDEETHRVDFAETPSYDAMVAAIGTLHGGHQACAKYIDEDGDLCTFCAETFEDFLATARENCLPGDDISARLLVVQEDNPCDRSDADLLEAWEHCELEEFAGVGEEFEWVGEEEASADSHNPQEELEASELNHEPCQMQPLFESLDIKSREAAHLENALEHPSNGIANDHAGNFNTGHRCRKSLDDTGQHPVEGPPSTETCEEAQHEEHSSQLCPRPEQCLADYVGYISMSPLARVAGALLTVPMLCSAPDVHNSKSYRSAGMRPLFL